MAESLCGYEKGARTIIADGGEAVFDIMPGLDHIAVCEAAFTTEHLDWVFSHVKGE